MFYILKNDTSPSGGQHQSALRGYRLSSLRFRLLTGFGPNSIFEIETLAVQLKNDYSIVVAIHAVYTVTGERSDS